MRNLLLTLALCGAAHAAYPNGYTYRYSFTVHTGKISGTLSNFSTVICANVTSGACTVTVAGLAGKFLDSNCSDVIITTDSAGSTLANFESVQGTCDAANGRLVLWQRKATVADGTVYYLFVGKSGVTTNQGYPAVGSSPFDTNTVVAWHLNTVTGAVSGTDSSGNSNTGTLIDTPTAAAGEIDGSADMSPHGTTAVQKASATGLPTGAAAHFRSGCWVKAASVVNLAQLCGWGEDVNTASTNGVGRYLLTISGGNILWWGRNADWDTGVPVDADNLWHRYDTVFEGTSQIFYRDGVQAAIRTGMPSGTTTSATTIEAGGNPAGTAGVQKIDELRIDATDRTAAWIAAEFANQSNNAAFWDVAGPTTFSSSSGFPIVMERQ